jgi:hypothetical protein
MAILYIQNWDIINGKEDEYTRFVSEIYIPKTAAMGLISVGGYYVEVGFGSRIIAVLTAENLAELSKIVESKAFKALAIGLKALVCNYTSSILEPTGRVKHEKYVIQKGVWKFNQYYDIRPGKKELYSHFVLEEYLPAMQKIDYVEVTGGWNVLFGGPSEIIAEFTLKEPVDVGRLLNNKNFRRVSLRLRSEYVMNYANRILRCTERFDDHKWIRL